MAALGDVMPTRKPTTRDLEMTLRGRIGSSGVISGKCRSDYLPFGRVIRYSRPPCSNPLGRSKPVVKRNSPACAALGSADLPARVAGTRQHSQSRRRRSATTAAGEPRFPPRIFRLDRLRRKSSAGVLRRVAGSASQIGGLARQIINRAAKLGLELARCLVQLAVDLGAGIARQTANRILYAAQGLLAFTLV
jgi:hypothetical protein